MIFSGVEDGFESRRDRRLLRRCHRRRMSGKSKWVGGWGEIWCGRVWELGLRRGWEFKVGRLLEGELPIFGGGEGLHGEGDYEVGGIFLLLADLGETDGGVEFFDYGDGGTGWS